MERLKAGANQSHLPDQLVAFYISGDRGVGIKRLFMTHPPLEEHIVELRRSPKWRGVGGA